MKTQKWNLRAEKFIMIKEIYNRSTNNGKSFMLSPSVDDWLKMNKNRRMGVKSGSTNNNHTLGN